MSEDQHITPLSELALSWFKERGMAAPVIISEIETTRGTWFFLARNSDDQRDWIQVTEC